MELRKDPASKNITAFVETVACKVVSNDKIKKRCDYLKKFTAAQANKNKSDK